MKNLIFIGSHLGYPMDRTPLGGGAMVGMRLARHWARSQDFQLTVLGAGSHVPGGASYLRLGCPSFGEQDPDLIHLSEWRYARFCREFEAASTAYLGRNAKKLDPRRTVVVVNDISESPDLSEVARLGYRLVSVWHVDVVDFFNRLYLGNVLKPQTLTWSFDRLERWGLGRLVPHILRLVFKKQCQAVTHSDRIVMPSRGMAQTLKRCYESFSRGDKGPLESRILTIPWGGWREEFPEDEIEALASRLKAHYQIKPQTSALMTLSRISPEKGIAILIEALKRLEAAEDFSTRDICLFICGEPAFMRGESYARRVRAAAGGLKRFRVFFPGYLAPFEKQAYFRLAHLFVSPSIHESYGLTLVEAMQAGLPILASDHYGVDECVLAEFGRKVSYARAQGRVPALALALRKMLCDPAALRSMGLKAKAASERMTFSAAADRLLEASLSLVKSSEDPVGSLREKS